MIRVLHYGLDSKLGGIETYVYKLYTNINRDEFKFDFLVTGDKEVCWYKEFTKMGSEFYRVTPRNKNVLKNKAELSKLFKNEYFDVVHCHLNSLSCITPIEVALKNNVSIIVHSRNACMIKSKISKLLHKINYFLVQKEKITMLAVFDLVGKWMHGKNCNLNVKEKIEVNIVLRNIINYRW